MGLVLSVDFLEGEVLGDGESAAGHYMEPRPLAVAVAEIEQLGEGDILAEPIIATPAKNHRTGIVVAQGNRPRGKDDVAENIGSSVRSDTLDTLPCDGLSSPRRRAREAALSLVLDVGSIT